MRRRRIARKLLLILLMFNLPPQAAREYVSHDIKLMI